MFTGYVEDSEAETGNDGDDYTTFFNSSLGNCLTSSFACIIYVELYAVTIVLLEFISVIVALTNPLLAESTITAMSFVGTHYLSS